MILVDFVHFRRSVIESLLGYARDLHPREGVLLLRGKVSGEKIVIDDTLIPPLATHGQRFSSFPLYMLPIDFSIVGVAHSHPSGVQAPSVEDLNHFYGRIMVIIAFPYQSEQDIVVFSREGEKVNFETIR